MFVENTASLLLSINERVNNVALAMMASLHTLTERVNEVIDAAEERYKARVKEWEDNYRVLSGPTQDYVKQQLESLTYCYEGLMKRVWKVESDIMTACNESQYAITDLDVMEGEIQLFQYRQQHPPLPPQLKKELKAMKAARE